MIWRWHIQKVVLRLPEREPKTNSTHYGVDAGIWTRATMVGGERSHTAPSLAILMTLIFNGRLHWFTKYQTIAAHYNFSLL